MTPRLLVPFTLPEPRPVSSHLVKALANLEVVLLGHYALPEQTPPDAARDQFQDEALRQLEALAADFDEAGIETETRLLFGQNLRKAIDQVAEEEGCGAFLMQAPVKEFERVFVPVLDLDAIERLVEFVTALVGGSTTLTLGTIILEGGSHEKSERLLDEVRDRLTAAGVAPDRIDTAIAESNDHDAAIIAMADGHDAVVMKEPDPSVAERILGTLPKRIANETVLPIVVVRRKE